RHQATVDEIAPERGHVRMEKRESHIDLLLLVVAVLGKALVEDHREEQVALARLRRDRDQPSVAEERSDDLLSWRQVAKGRLVGHRPDRTRPPATMARCCPTDDALAPISRWLTVWSRRLIGRPSSAHRRSRSSPTTRRHGSAAPSHRRRSPSFASTWRLPGSRPSRSTPRT